MEFLKVIRLPDEDSGIERSIVRVSNNLIGQGLMSRRSPVLIKNQETKRWIVRYVMGNNGKVKGLNNTTLALDYDAVHDLGVRYGETKLEVKKASLVQSIVWLCRSPDLNVRLSMCLSLIGFFLGVIGFIQAIVQSL